MANSDGYPWESEDDRLQYTRVFVPSRMEQAQMGAALAFTGMPAQQIREVMMTPPPAPPRFNLAGNGTDILTCWEDSQLPVTHSIMDYTGDEAALQSTARPSLGQW